MLRKLIDNIKPNFEKGGKLSFLGSAFNAVETLLFVSNKVTTKGTHIRDAIDMKRTMIVVVIALIPALIFGIWNVGYQHYLAMGEAGAFWNFIIFGATKVIPIIIVSYVVGLSIEIAFAQSRKHEVNEGFFVSGMLIPLILPVTTPLWMVAVATAFAVIIGKEVFGGTGMNLFNPALLARAFLFFSYPAYLSGDSVWISGLADGKVIDGFTGATPLAQLSAEGANGTILSGLGSLLSVKEMFFGLSPGSIGETSVAAILIGAGILIYTGVGSWKIMLSVAIGGLSMGFLLNLFAVNPFMAVPAYQQLLLGGFAFGAVFMATDPVSAAQTEKGKWIYGFLIGFFAILIRVINPAYPEGVMLAILFMNVFSPLIDYFVVEANIKQRLNRLKVKLDK